MTREQASIGTAVTVLDPIYYSRGAPPLPAGLPGHIAAIYPEDDMVYQVDVDGVGPVFYAEHELSMLSLRAAGVRL